MSKPREMSRSRRMVTTLHRIARADDRSIHRISSDAGFAFGKGPDKWFKDDAVNPRIDKLMAFADAVGYEIVLKRKKQDKSEGSP